MFADTLSFVTETDPIPGISKVLGNVGVPVTPPVATTVEGIVVDAEGAVPGFVAVVGVVGGVVAGVVVDAVDVVGFVVGGVDGAGFVVGGVAVVEVVGFAGGFSVTGVGFGVAGVAVVVFF